MLGNQSKFTPLSFGVHVNVCIFSKKYVKKYVKKLAGQHQMQKNEKILTLAFGRRRNGLRPKWTLAFGRRRRGKLLGILNGFGGLYLQGRRWVGLHLLGGYLITTLPWVGGHLLRG